MISYKSYASELASTLESFDYKSFDKFVIKIKKAIKKKRNIFFIGNGGSASTASHLAADIGKNTGLIPAPKTISLCDNISFITALSNDLSYEDIFSEQIKNLGNNGDLLIAISGSGNSKNIIKAVEVADKIGMYTVGLLGFKGGKLMDMVDLPLLCNSDNYGIIESAHSFIHHYLVESLKIKE